MMKLELVEGNVIQNLRAVSGAFTSMAEAKNIYYHCQFPVEEIVSWFDPDNETIMPRLEKENLKYIMATRMMGPLVRRIFEHKKWFPMGDGYWSASFEYQGKGWSQPRRMVVVRKDTGKH